MFGKFFKKKGQPSTPSSSTPKRDLFDELFPLTEEKKSKFDDSINALFSSMFNDEGKEELLNYSREFPLNEVKFGSLRFNDMKWDQKVVTEERMEYHSHQGDLLLAGMVRPNGEMKKEESQIGVYRNWLRELAVKQGGGLILCEEFKNPNGVEGYESIIKVPRQEGRGMDYIYFLNMPHYGEERLYQLQIKVHEMNPTGMRDNLSVQTFCQITQTGMMDILDLYQQDPYQKDFKEGNRMNLSEREEFDTYFPFHPLSIIRMGIRPNLILSVRFE
ncbi:hypothetical protein KFE98_02820 [bacterium SCSIO 12741]|nr:hypothetical protein KFE98_02820 [bacterium SCSIO 12741]